VSKDGSILRISYSTAPFEFPEGRGAVTAFTDIEAQREAERVERERDIAEARAAELGRARRRIIEAADTARAQLTRDLHDGAQQHFVSAVLNLRLAERTESADRETARELRRSALRQISDGIAELRDLAAGLHPAVLTERGLGPAIEALVARLPIPVGVARGFRGRLPGPVETSVYFFVSEALTNVVKHAGATRARVNLAVEAGHLIVEVADDGVGGAPDASSGTGLTGLADRVAALDGDLTVTSPRGHGTTLRASIPLSPDAAGASPR
jgi:signal transduction histidine kinase